MSAETVTFTVTKKIADADGTPIREGSILREITTGEVGVVVRIVRPNQGAYGLMTQIGDVMIKTCPGLQIGTNRYDQWRHVPSNEQTYYHRYLSWLKRTYDHDECREISEDEGVAIDGIMALLPEDTVDWEKGPWPDRLEDALKFMMEHLTELKNDGTERLPRE